MRNLVIVLASMLVSGVGFRVRGGAYNIGPHTLSRLAWAAPVGIIAAVASNQVEALVTIPFLFAACTLPAFGANDMGRNDGTLHTDAFFVLVRGLALSAAVAGPLYVMGIVDMRYAFAILGIGIFMPAFYELGWRTPSSLPNLERGSAIAELYFGLFYGLALASALVWR